MASQGSLSLPAEKIREILATSVASGTLSYFSELHVGPDDSNATRKMPWLVLDLDEPFIPIPEDFQAARNRKDNFLSLVIRIYVDPNEADRPFGIFGDSAKRGVLTMVEDVANELGLNFAAIIASGPTVMDMNVTARRGGKIEAARGWVAELVVTLRSRFTMGAM